MSHVSSFRAVRILCAAALAALVSTATARSEERPAKAASPIVPAGAAAPKKEDRVAAKAFLSVDRLPAGGTCRVVMVLTIQEGWHLKPNPAKTENAIATTFTVKSKHGVTLKSVQYPQGTPDDPDSPMPKPVYQNQVAVYGVLSVPKEAAGATEELDLEVKYQACKGADHCEFPKTLKLTGKLDVAPPGEAVGEINAKYFAPPSAPGK